VSCQRGFVATGEFRVSIGMQHAEFIDEEERPMKMIAYLLAIVSVIVAAMYLALPGGSSPTSRSTQGGIDLRGASTGLLGWLFRALLVRRAT
jgi:hypothetical protein